MADIAPVEAKSLDDFGLDPLLQRRVTFDFPERKLYFADSSAPVKAKAK